MSEIPNVFVVIDIETTGLSAENDAILEVACQVFDDKLETIASRSMLLVTDGWRAKIAGNQFVFNMHTKSRLIHDLGFADNLLKKKGNHEGIKTIRSLGPVFVPQWAYEGYNLASLQMRNWLVEDLGLPEEKLPMVGSSVHFDRAFLKRRMPVLEAFFSYRNLDISTLKELARLVNPRVFRNAEGLFRKENAVHRALPDIAHTMAELHFYLKHLVITTEKV